MMHCCLRKVSADLLLLRQRIVQMHSSTITLCNLSVSNQGSLYHFGDTYNIQPVRSVSSLRKCMFLPSRFVTNGAVEQNIKNGKDSASLQTGVVEAHHLEPVVLRQQNLRKNLLLLSFGAGASGLLLFVSAVTFVHRRDENVGYTEAGKELLAGVKMAGNKLWDSAAEVGKGMTNVTRVFSERLNSMIMEAGQAGGALFILLRCLNAILLSDSKNSTTEVGSWWRLKIAELLADLAGTSHNRRESLVETGDGVVIDWLFDAVCNGESLSWSTQEEAARALAHLIADPLTCERVLGRPHALPHLFHFASSIQPQLIEGAKHKKLQRVRDVGPGRSLLVATIMDIITSSCENGVEKVSQPKLPEDADPNDIAAALKVIEEGGLHMEEGRGTDGSGDTNGLHGIGIRVLGGTSVIGLQMLDQANMFNSSSQLMQLSMPLFLDLLGSSTNKQTVIQRHNATSPGLWDDLHGRHVSVPLAAWALASWAKASNRNCHKMMELDPDGAALMAAIIAPERTVKWHGAATIDSLLGDAKMSLEETSATWSSALLKMAVEAMNADDAPLAEVAANAFFSCIQESAMARDNARGKNLLTMHALAKQSNRNTSLQKALVQALEVLSMTGGGLSLDVAKRWSGILLSWVLSESPDTAVSSSASRILTRILTHLEQDGIPVSQTWLAMLLMDSLISSKSGSIKENAASSKSKDASAKGLVQVRGFNQSAFQAATQLLKLSMLAALGRNVQTGVQEDSAKISNESPMSELLSLDIFQNVTKTSKKEVSSKATAADAAGATAKGIKCLTQLAARDKARQQRLVQAGVLVLLRRFMLSDDYENLAALETYEASKLLACDEHVKEPAMEKKGEDINTSIVRVPQTSHLRKHAAHLLSILALHPVAASVIKKDMVWCKWLDDCANGQIRGCTDLKTQSYARTTLLNLRSVQNTTIQDSKPRDGKTSFPGHPEDAYPRYEDGLFVMKTDSCFWKQTDNFDELKEDDASTLSKGVQQVNEDFKMDVVFIHGLFGGPFKTWRIADDKSSATGMSDLIEKIDIDAGRAGTSWPREWLANDLPRIRLLTVKYKTNLSQWYGATPPLQEISSMLLEKLLAAGVGQRPVVFITHSMGGLVVKQMLMQAGQTNGYLHFVKQTSGIVFYSCPHFGSRLADMPWRIGIVLRPAPTIGELRSGSPRLEDLNRYIRNLHKQGLEILSFSETKVTPLVEGYGGWALRIEIVPIESAYPGFGELIVLDATDHINSCKPLSQTDPAYTATLHLLQKIERSIHC